MVVAHFDAEPLLRHLKGEARTETQADIDQGREVAVSCDVAGAGEMAPNVAPRDEIERRQARRRDHNQQRSLNRAPIKPDHGWDALLMPRLRTAARLGIAGASFAKVPQLEASPHLSSEIALDPDSDSWPEPASWGS